MNGPRRSTGGSIGRRAQIALRNNKTSAYDARKLVELAGIEPASSLPYSRPSCTRLVTSFGAFNCDGLGWYLSLSLRDDPRHPPPRGAVTPAILTGFDPCSCPGSVAIVSGYAAIFSAENPLKKDTTLELPFVLVIRFASLDQ